MTTNGKPDGGHAREVLRQTALLCGNLDVTGAPVGDGVVHRDHLPAVVVAESERRCLMSCTSFVFDDDGPHLMELADCPDQNCGGIRARLVAIGDCVHGIETDLDLFGADLDEAMRRAKRVRREYVADGWS